MASVLSRIQLNLPPQAFDLLTELVNMAYKQVANYPAELRPHLEVLNAHVQVQALRRAEIIASKRPVGRPAKAKPTREERQTALLAQGYVWVTYQGERSLWPADHLPVDGIRDDGSEIKHTVT